MNIPAAFRCAILTASLIAPLVLPLGVQAQPKHYLIKGSGPAVYFNADDGKRYVFPNESVFKSWYPVSANIALVSDTELAALPLGGNVTYRPGSKLVKITTDPRVYAISRYGVLHWITSETLAASLYGTDWNTKVADVPDTFFINYIVGYQVDAASQYSASTELAAAPTPQENMRPIGYVPPLASATTTTPNPARVDVSLSTSQAALNQSVSVVATVNGSTVPISRIDIRAESSPAILTTCLNTTTCSHMFTVATAPMSERYYAEAKDTAGATFQTPVWNRPSLMVSAASNQIQISATPQTVIVGSRASFSSDASKIGSISSHKILALIPGEPVPVLWKDCGATNYCAGSSPFYRTTSLYSQVTTGGQTLASPPVSVQVVGGEPPKATLTVTGHPSKNQVQINVDAPYGEMINATSLVDGTSINNTILAICQGSCTVVLQVNLPGSVTAFTWVGGKYERSNTITVSPE